ncbi:MAG: NACHT domain-containing protein [Byssovorax sp.]
MSTETQRSEPPEGTDPQAWVQALVEQAPAGNRALPAAVERNRRKRAVRRLADALEARGPYPLSPKLRGELSTLVARWARHSFEDAFSEADDLEIRCAEERAVLDAEAAGDRKAQLEAAERVYRHEVVKRHGTIEIRGLQTSQRVFQALDKLYVPLWVEEPPPPGPVEPPAEAATPLSVPAARKAGSKKAAAKKADTKKSPRKAAVPRKKASPRKQKTPVEAAALSAELAQVMEVMQRLQPPRVKAAAALGKYPRLVVVGDPGSGKSTLVAHLALMMAEGKLATEAGWTEDPVPFVVPVRSLGAAPMTVEALATAAGCEEWFLGETLKAGRALLLVDGLDEARREVGDALVPKLLGLLERGSGNRLVATTRPGGGMGAKDPGTDWLVRVKLLPMGRQDVDEFIDKWCLAAEESIQQAATFEKAQKDAEVAAADLKKRVRERQAVERLAASPLLCSVLCLVHRFMGQRVPERRTVLYEVTTNVLLYEWDRSKFPGETAIGELDAPAKRVLLSAVARHMHELRVAELKEGEVVRILAERLPDVRPQKAGISPVEEARSIVAEIRDRSGVLVERRAGEFGFSHMAFQEYLTAHEMVRLRDFDGLAARYVDEWWHEVIVLSAGIPGTDAERLVAGLLDKDGDKIGAGTMLAAQCSETAVSLSAKLRDRIESRIVPLIPPQNFNAMQSLLSIGQVAAPLLLRFLDAPNPDDKVRVAFVLGVMRYTPAARLVARLLTNDEVTSTQIKLWSDDDWLPKEVPLYSYAVGLFGWWSAVSLEVESIHEEMLPHMSDEALVLTYNLRGELSGDIRALARNLLVERKSLLISLLRDTPDSKYVAHSG